MAKEVDLEQLSVDELDAMHTKIMEAKAKKAIEQQNELVAEFQNLRERMVAAGVVGDDFPRLKKRGWTRSVPARGLN